MDRSTITILAVPAVAIGAWFLWSTASSVYFTPAAALNTRIVQATGRINELEAALADRKAVNAEVSRFVHRTLGPNLETVDHRLRTRLNRIAEEEGLADARISTGLSSTRLSPAAAMFQRSGLQRALREESDFVELEGSISGVGTLEQVVRLVERIEDEAWIKRIDSLRLDPSDNGGRVRINVGLRTLFVPGREAKSPPPGPGDGAKIDQHLALVKSNPFRVPPPVAAQAPPPPTPDPPPQPKFPYETWSLTGVATSPHGHEAWLLNTATHEARRLAIGERLGEATLVAIEGLEAEFDQTGSRFRIEVGRSMHDRRSVGH